MVHDSESKGPKDKGCNTCKNVLKDRYDDPCYCCKFRSQKGGVDLTGCKDLYDDFEAI
jgi:hypothetical protein